MRNLTTLCSAFVLFFIMSATNAGNAETVKNTELQTLANELINGLDNYCRNPNKISISGNNFCSKNNKVRIALRPFSEEEIPIAQTVARKLNNEFLNNLLKISDNRFHFVTREELEKLEKEIYEFGGSIKKFWRKAGNVDILIVGKLEYKKPNVILSYKALGKTTADIIASTVSRKFPISVEHGLLMQPAVKLDTAVIRAARDLAEKAADMTTLVLGNIVFQTSGAQPPFGSYVRDRLSIALQTEFTNIISGRKLKVIDNKNVGLDVSQPYYTLTGSYWDLSGSLELRVKLRNKENEAVSWVGWIRPETIAQRLRPEGDFGHIRKNDGFGPFDFHLTSNLGLNPVYRIGDKLKINLLLDRDAWVYCFNITATNSLYQIFPNPHYLKENKEPRLTGQKKFTIPGKHYKLFPWDLEVTKPTGIELIKCFAASRNITPELPEKLRGITTKELPKTILRNLTQIFENTGAEISEQSFVITVVE